MAFWSVTLKIAGGVVAGIVGDEGVKAIVNWRDESQACEAISILFHSCVVDERGEIREGRNGGFEHQVADLSFVATPLKLDDLVAGSVYCVEVANLTLPGSDPSRVRYFGYDSNKFTFWLEKPSSNHMLSAPSVWPPISTEEASIEAIEREVTQAGVTWFQCPLTPGMKAFWALPTSVPTFAVVHTLLRRQEKG